MLLFVLQISTDNGLEKASVVPTRVSIFDNLIPVIDKVAVACAKVIRATDPGPGPVRGLEFSAVVETLRLGMST